MLRRRTFIGLDEEKANIPDRGDGFLSHVYHICQSEKIQDLLTLFRTRTAYYDMDKDWRFYRVLSHWDSKGLIECERESMDGWRKFNLIEALWVSVIQRLRHLRISPLNNEHLTQLQSFLSSQLKQVGKFEVLQIHKSFPSLICKICSMKFGRG